MSTNGSDSFFGDKPSPDLAAYALKFLADTNKNKYPLATSILENDTYVDDIGFSAEEALEVDKILSCSKFSVKTWNSNNIELDQNTKCNMVDILGHNWDKRNDLISMKHQQFTTSTDTFTKRGVMGMVAKLRDPFGFPLPVTMKYRLGLQKIWLHKFDWDENLPLNLVEEWNENIHQMKDLADITVERCLKPPKVTAPLNYMYFRMEVVRHMVHVPF